MRLLRALLAAVALLMLVAAPAHAASSARIVYPVTVLSTGRITFSGDSGGVPITVENTSSAPVTVTIELIGFPSSRLDSEPVENVVVDPGMRNSIEIEARIIGDGPLDASVRVTSPTGKRLALPATVTLASAAYARAAGWVVLVAFIALAIFVVVGVTRRIRKAHAARKPPASGSMST
ncbi:MAG: hypothetical protein RL205_1344 [Actinomycetota bacterium]|jgi:hypothetical protein